MPNKSRGKTSAFCLGFNVILQGAESSPPTVQRSVYFEIRRRAIRESLLRKKPRLKARPAAGAKPPPYNISLFSAENLKGS